MDKQSNINWQGLFNWSTQYHDGTTESNPNITPMSDEDKKWLTEAMEQYTFDDANKLTEICELMKKEVEIGFDASKGSL